MKKMGTLNRGRYGGGPPFLVCALVIGLTIISVSYYQLSLQYTQIQAKLGEVAQQNVIMQEHLREQQTQKLAAELSLAQSQSQLNVAQKKIEANKRMLDMASVKNDKLKEDLIKKEGALIELQKVRNELEMTKKQLNDRDKTKKEVIGKHQNEEKDELSLPKPMDEKKNDKVVKMLTNGASSQASQKMKLL